VRREHDVGTAEADRGAARLASNTSRPQRRRGAAQRTCERGVVDDAAARDVVSVALGFISASSQRDRMWLAAE